MMDPEQRLRELGHVDPDRTRISPELARRALTPPKPRRFAPRVRVGLVLAPAAAALAVVILLVAGGSGGRGDLAGRAYAAMTGDAVFHWRTQTTSPSGAQQITEGWSYHGQLHLVGYDVAGGRPVLTSDRRIADGRQQLWSRASQETTDQPAAPPTNIPSPLSDSDPVQTFRVAYESGTVTQVNDHTVRVPLGADYNGQPASVTYTLNADTGLPTRLAVLNELVTFRTYQRLDPTEANIALLQLLPGHTVQPGADDPAAVFAALRQPDNLSRASRSRLETLAAHLDPGNAIRTSGIRQVTGGVWLLPGRRHVCIAISAADEPSSLASSCVATAKARKDGVAAEAAGTTTIAVPDGIANVDVTTDQGTRSFSVTNGVIVVQGPLRAYTLR